MIRKKIRIVLSGLIALALFVSIIPPIPVSAEPPQETYGMPRVDLLADTAYWTPTNRAKSVVYMRALEFCLNLGDGLPVNDSNPATNAAIASGDASNISNWLKTGPASTAAILTGSVSHIYGSIIDPNGDGTLGCDNENGWIDDALTLWKFGSKIEALCTWGWFRYNGDDNPTKPGTYDDCVNGQGGELRNTWITKDGTQSGETTSIKLFNTRMSWARNIYDIPLLGTDTYVIYNGTLTAKSGCGARYLATKDSATADQKSILDGKQGVLVKVVVGSGKDATVEEQIWQLKDGISSTDAVKIATYVNGRALYTPSNPDNSSPSQDGGNSCGYIAQIANNFIASFLEDVENGKANPEDLLEPETCTNDTNGTCGTQSCGVEGIGWIICPVFDFLGGVADGTYSLVEGLLVTNVKILDTNGGTYNAWQIMRNFGNIGFVIAFLIIIFSQITGAGITNYGVKKMLPRIVVAAILVNLSFFIAQGAVDLSNILGSSLKGLLDNVAVFDSTFNNSTLAKGNVFTDIVSGILSVQAVGTAAVAGAAAIYFGGIGLLIPIILAAVVAIAMTLFILIARQAIIILLIVVSPLAFLAMLLPNTENLFKQWRKIFVSMLLLYPIISLLFGASQLAAIILLNSLGGSGTIGQLSSLAVMVLPLFALPALLKGSLNAIPAIGNLATKLTNSATSAARKGGAKGTQLLGERAAANATRGGKIGKFASFASGSMYGRGRAGRQRAAAARRSFEEPRIKDIQDGWANDGILNDADELNKKVTQHGVDSIEGQAAIARLGQMGDTDKLTDIRASVSGDKAKLAAYDKAILPHFTALKAKDYRSVFSDAVKPGESASPLQSKYASAKANDLYTMSDSALAAAWNNKGTGGDAFRKTLTEALGDPDQARYFNQKIRQHVANNGGPSAPGTSSLAPPPSLVLRGDDPQSYIDIEHPPK